MSDLKARIGDRQVPSKFEHRFIKKSSRRPSKSGTHHPVPTTVSKSLLSRIGPVSPVRGTAARHDSLPLASSQMDSRTTSTPILPTSALLCTPETKWRTASKPVNLTSNAPVEGEIEQSVGASDIRSDNLPANNGDSPGLLSNGAAEHAYFSKTSNSGKSPISSTASTPQRHSSESEIVLDMLCLTPSTPIPSVPLEEPNQIQHRMQMPLLREALLPAMVKNVQRRPSFDNTHESEKIRDRLQQVLSDEFCGSLVEKMRSIQDQIQAIRSEEARRAPECQLATSPTNSAGLDGLTRGSNFPLVQASTAASMPARRLPEMDIMSIPSPSILAPLSEPPKAPRAMRLLETQIQELSMISPGSSAVLDQPCSRSRSNEIQPEDLHFRGRRSRSGGRDVLAGGSLIRSDSSTRTHQDNNLRPSGIPIPMDPSFFATPPTSAIVQKNEFPSPKRHRSASRPARSPARRRSTERSRKDVNLNVRQGESSHLSPRYRSPSVTRRRSPSWPPRWTVAGPQTTRSPSRRYRSRSRPPQPPSRRPYSPPAKRRRFSFSKPRSPRTQRSVSRSRRSLPRRSLSPPVRRRTPVHLRTISREHRSPSPRHRGCRPTPPRPRLHRSPSPGLVDSQHLGRRSPSPCVISAQRHLSRSPPTPYRRTPPPRRPYRHRLSRPPDKGHPELIKLKSILHPPLPPPPSSPRRQWTSSDPDNRRTPTPIPDYDRTQPPPPADIMTIKREPDIEDFAAALRTSPSPAPQVPLGPPLPCHNVPGLWVVKMGHDQADVLVCEFEVDSETAKKWDLLSPSVSGNTATKLSLQLRCLSKELVQTVYETSLPSATAGDMAVELSKIKSEWPPQGSLIVQVNPAERYGRSWLPTHMAPPSPALDLTDSICEGLNVVQLIQLTDMADKIFVLQAIPLPANEQDLADDLPTYWDIAAFDLPYGLTGSGSMPSATIEVN